MTLIDAYTEQGTRSASSGQASGEEEGNPSASSGQGRVVLNLSPKLAPYKVAVFPLLANKDNLVEKAKGIYDELKQNFSVTFDARGNIGKRYLYQDEIGTPWCVTVDFESLEDEAVTIRDRITTQQERVKIVDLVSYFSQKLI